MEALIANICARSIQPGVRGSRDLGLVGSIVRHGAVAIAHVIAVVGASPTAPHLPALHSAQFKIQRKEEASHISRFPNPAQIILNYLMPSRPQRLPPPPAVEKLEGAKLDANNDRVELTSQTLSQSWMISSGFLPGRIEPVEHGNNRVIERVGANVSRYPEGANGTSPHRWDSVDSAGLSRNIDKGIRRRRYRHSSGEFMLAIRRKSGASTELIPRFPRSFLLYFPGSPANQLERFNNLAEGRFQWLR